MCLEREPGELDAEGRRLGVDAVRPPDTERVHVFARTHLQGSDALIGAGQDHLADGP